MKKLLLSLGACSLAFAAPVAIPTAASAEPATGLVEICKAFNEANPGVFKSTGDCVSSQTQICNELKKLGLLEFYGFKNQGECVNYIKAFYN